MKPVRTLIAIATLAAFGAGAAQAATLAEIQKAGVFRVGTEGTYPPFTYHDASGNLTGFDVDIARAIAAKLGVKVEFLEGRWDGLIAGIDADRYDAVINEVGITDARKKKYDFSEPYIASKAALIVRSDDDTIKSFADLKGKTAAQSLSSNFGQIAKDNGADLIGTDGFAQSIALVIQHRADATVNDSLSYLDFKKHKPNAPVKLVATLPNADYSGVIIAKNQPKLLAAINTALDEMKADGTYLKISQKYFGEDVSK
ncbi:amino acid ABC transporter substrate-binding protein [Thioclava sp. BHET1]|uniref:Amino acid ABC transporter substrate-binding protein n=1 Tax=Thioclava dalianensis TaxID=1185766 RepID=A0A074TNI2_9RHOB|nr:amino acid ABC transporter substrate-binding protein [Thioclava dalianensis]KEP71710.1 amino acid ABC transporter substrate-binding protein [Thioclava dalianensis]TMV89975.1 amino acid ABC transporter substrate-binding protein [Thioclava sp. BHET1]SFN40532.1 cystine transport system substrate-binding protein [Thioclava dalianensis]